MTIRDRVSKACRRHAEGQMTEADWLSCHNPQKMLEFVRGQVSQRKLRLFAVACCRRHWDKLTEQGSRDAVELAERYADGSVPKEELVSAWLIAEEVRQRRWEAWSSSSDPTSAQEIAAHFADAAADAAAQPVHAEDAFADAAVGVAAIYCHAPSITAEWREAMAREWSAQCRLLRDLLGPLPFRDVRVPASVLSWNDGCVVKLTTAIYEGREFTPERMGVLADALEDAGLKDEEVLRHCRQEGVHVRGCWVVDLLLGKSCGGP